MQYEYIKIGSIKLSNNNNKTKQWIHQVGKKEKLGCTKTFNMKNLNMKEKSMGHTPIKTSTNNN